ncbi:Eukaryotic peptide chain release factor GTP-binding subunit [Ophidiomyces ophidiicola]|uniref:Eukaryotic peptide chain release factor GTP-binding subunit n=1 Tax=Ophidiomyces ophidiicola TaxID=1387563 RepID=UPI0020C58743|nr:Eukaryotic peptide chain release factor GTP-binding subunit [Ophidiomyces ophidiicola]KAI1950335.1 Eukaryotic peptide chain release factor GTP-binding subunit [Ophidiomyces ophidiicola]KAI2001961.1 Eukaryotic peptide chain release factor GTP-binding subunit [Ophidiomyces ophidiicola]KAI2013297.1 Eukaryotic peptide chain release factor GTP-binding subunit [Ophidiomyces ophidiicola]KAI2016801.1 Eukaryotic peptide chain release factor GTP-binding subunit [Ophidiomyces ophidiicola]KAI2099994.1 
MATRSDSQPPPGAAASDLDPASPNTDARPLSYISSHMTDIQSEDGELRSQSPPIRSHRSPSRPFARHSMSTASTQGAIPAGNRMSRTHVPSITSHAFFRPMSSQRLQMQRSVRPPTATTHGVSSEDGQSDIGSQARRSLISNPNTLAGFGGIDYEPPPPSRGTEFTDPIFFDRGTSTASPTGNTTVRSGGDSVRLLHERSRRSVPSNLNLGATRNEVGLQDPPQRSPLSFRSGFLKSNKNEHPERQDTSDHERLSSATSSPASTGLKPVRPIPHKTSKDLGKNYEYFTGNTIFFWGGRLQNSRDRPVNIATAIFVVLPGALFFAYSAPWLWHHVSPAIPILFSYVFFLTVSSFLHASLVDPGIYPRNLHVNPPANPSEDPLTLGPPNSDWVMVKLATSEMAAMDVPVKYCRTCSLWRPPRCYHCRTCDNCIETLDHHCVWLNNCVGRRNYRFFFSFVSTATICALFLLGASLTHILIYQSREAISFGQSIDKWRVPFAMVIYGAIAAPYPAALCGYHLFLIGRGETTREYLNSHKFVKADRHRPFTQGNIWRNWISVFGRPRPPSYVEFKKPYTEGDQRFPASKVKRRVRDVEAQPAELEMRDVKRAHPTFQGPSGRGPLNAPPAA